MEYATIKEQYNKLPDKKKRSFLVSFAKKTLGIEEEQKGSCEICWEPVLAHWLCARHYHGWSYNRRTHGTTKEQYVAYKKKDSDL